MTAPRTRSAWSRRMRSRALLLLGLGLALLLVGSFMIGGDAPMPGVLVGSLGVVAITFGALCGRYATAGPFPHGLLDDTRGAPGKPSGDEAQEGGR